MSPLSLLLFRLVVVSISSGFFFFVFVSFFPFPPFTKVHPSSLLGSASVSGCVLFLASVFVSVVFVGGGGRFVCSDGGGFLRAGP